MLFYSLKTFQIFRCLMFIKMWFSIKLSIIIKYVFYILQNKWRNEFQMCGFYMFLDVVISGITDTKQKVRSITFFLFLAVHSIDRWVITSKSRELTQSYSNGVWEDLVKSWKSWSKTYVKFWKRDFACYLLIISS